MDIPLLVIDAALGLTLTAATLWCSYVLASTMTRNAGTAVRATAAAVVLLWLLSVALPALSPLKLFLRPVVLAGWCAAAFAAHRYARARIDLGEVWRRDVGAIAAWWGSLTQPFRIVIGVGAGCVAVRLIHGLVAPCLTWDALTYHLYKPAVWAQSAAMVSTAGPDAAGYYAWFPPYGDAVWAWWLLVMRGDVANAPIAVAQWLLIPIAGYAVARTIGATPLRATAAALALAFTPATINLSGAIYVDNLVVALWAAGVLFLARSFGDGGTIDAALAAAAFAVLAGVKGSVVPIAGLGILAALGTTRTPRAAALVIAAAIPACVPSLHAWYVTGSPVYPLTVRIGDRMVFAGNSELEWLLKAGWMTPAALADARQRLFGRLFFPWERLNTDFFNLGLGAFFLLPAFVCGLWSFRARWRDRALLAFLVMSALLTMAGVAGEANVALRLWWWGLLGRLVMIAFAAAVFAAAKWPSRWATACLWLCAASGLVVAWPRGVTMLDVRAALAVLPAILIGAATLAFARQYSVRVRAVTLAAVLIGITVALVLVRDRFRYQFYEAAAQWRAYDTHPIDGRWTASWPIWQRLDTEPGSTIAVAAGWDGIGHNWYRYPLMGRRLQNRLIYVPVTESGEFVDYGRSDRAGVSCNAWRRRLAASGAQYFLLLPPIPFEEAWIRALPGAFVHEATLRFPGTALYRIDAGKLNTAICPAD